MTREQIQTLITDNITTNSNGEITAIKVKTILDAFATDYRHLSDEITLSQVTDLVSSLAGKQATLTATNLKTIVDSLVEMTTPIDADKILSTDSAGTTAKKLSWTNVKAFLKTYFDGIYQAILISGTNIKTINGSSILGSGNLDVSSGGVFGISNSSGIYTYYSTLTLAMASATAGQTIEMFADYTETGAVSITMKAGVIIHGNGHSYNHSHASATHTFLFPTNANYYIYNLQVNRTNATAGAYVFYHVAYSPYTVFCNGTTIRTNKGGVWFHFSQQGNIHNLTAEFSGSGDVGFSGSGSNFNNCTILGTSTSSNVLASGGAVLNNCTVVNRGTEIAVGETFLNGTTVNSYASAAANGCYGVKNSWLYSATSYALLPYNNFTVENSVIQSAGSYAAYIYNSNCRFDNCVLISSTGNAFYSTLGGNVKLSNCVLKSIASVALNAHSVEATNCTIDSLWDNAGGHAVAILSSDTIITNCTLRVVNASANGLYGASAFTPKFANNVYVGMTTKEHANITQGVTNFQDNQGNILI